MLLVVCVSSFLQTMWKVVRDFDFSVDRVESQHRRQCLIAVNEAERAASIMMRKRHWGRTVGRSWPDRRAAPMAVGFFEA